MKTSFWIVAPVMGAVMVTLGIFALGAMLLTGTFDADSAGAVYIRERALILLGIGAAIFAVGTAYAVYRALARAQALTRDLRLLPRAFQRLVRQGEDALLPGELRADALGRAVRGLRQLGLKLQAELSSRAEIERQAITDPLTELPNRRALMAFLDEAIPRLERNRNLALLHVDLDHFKVINDTLGHDAGDAVLKEATDRMTAILRGSDMLARLGGDEFIIVAHGLVSQDALEILAERVVQQFARPIPYGPESCTVGASVGAVLAVGADGPYEAKRLLANADVALCEAKAAGRNRWSIFTVEMAAILRRRSRQSREIREALLDGEFRAWYQPVIDHRDGRVIGAELLSRWEHPERGLLLPQEFLLPAETHNMLEEIGLQVLEQACSDLQRWRLNGVDVPMMHINMTRAQLVAPGVVDKVSWILDDCSIAPESVSVEINEQSCEGRSVELVFANLGRFRDLGAQTILDDFGGFSSSISNVVNIEASQIKCDRALAADLMLPRTSKRAQYVLSGVLGVGEKLGVEIIAKGVEDPAQMRALRNLGIMLMQGDALAPAMSGEDLVAFLDRAELAAAQSPGIA